MTDILKSGGQFALFAEVYQFLRTWAARCPLSEAAWDAVVQEANAIGERYRGGPLEALANALIYASISELERISRTS